MPLEQRCSSGHYYDTAKFSSCPYCGVGGLDAGKGEREFSRTVPKRHEHQPQNSQPEPLVSRQVEPGATVGMYRKEIGIDPPVGWLVCIDGPDRGNDYKIRSENNSIGRSETMRICISSDDTIARENHAFLTYDPESNTYSIHSGLSRGLVYKNGLAVYGAEALKPFDQIKLGQTILLFVPLCGNFGENHFRWA